MSLLPLTFYYFTDPHTRRQSPHVDNYVHRDLSNRPGRPFWPVARPEKKRAGPARPSTVAGRAGTAQKERAVLGQGCQPACHAGRPAVPAYRADPPCRPTVPAQRAGPTCRPTVPAHRAGPTCRPNVPAHRAGPTCRPTVPGHPLYQFSFFI